MSTVNYNCIVSMVIIVGIVALDLANYVPTK